MTRRATISILVAVWLGACSSSRGVEPEDAGRDAGVARDAGPGPDGGAVDGGTRDSGAGVDAGTRDAGTHDAGEPIDAGGGADAGPPTCAADSCEARTCGRSFCAAPCGECATGSYCSGAGACVAGSPPGSFCVDAFGENVAEGGRSFRICPVDPSLLQSCLCSGGGPEAWVACGDCQEVRLAGGRGDRCADARQCGGGPCHPFLHLCGESCMAGMDTCPAGTTCGIPGDVSGVCLDPCETCGAACGASGTCRPTDDGLVCVPAGYPWARSC